MSRNRCPLLYLALLFSGDGGTSYVCSKAKSYEIMSLKRLFPHYFASRSAASFFPPWAPEQPSFYIYNNAYRLLWPSSSDCSQGHLVSHLSHHQLCLNSSALTDWHCNRLMLCFIAWELSYRNSLGPKKLALWVSPLLTYFYWSTNRRAQICSN